jgi:hypothetical protein
VLTGGDVETGGFVATGGDVVTGGDVETGGKTLIGGFGGATVGGPVDGGSTGLNGSSPLCPLSPFSCCCRLRVSYHKRPAVRPRTASTSIKKSW